VTGNRAIGARAAPDFAVDLVNTHLDAGEAMAAIHRFATILAADEAGYPRLMGLTRGGRANASRRSTADAPPISIDNQAPGLWLWSGNAPLSPPLPTSPVQNGLGQIVFAARRARWRALSRGLALAALASSVILYSMPLEELASPGIPGVALQPVPSTTVAPPISAATPVSLTGTQSKKAHTHTAPAAKMKARPTERHRGKKPVHRTSRRQTNASFVLSVPRPPPVLPPVAPAPEPMTWHGGGY
jgi:hypothetical protein